MAKKCIQFRTHNIKLHIEQILIEEKISELLYIGTETIKYELQKKKTEKNKEHQ